jgi:ParB family chromosome partitioning protein
MQVVYLNPAHIKVGPNRRAIDPAVVKELAESIAKIGMRQPITVRQDGGDDYTLVAGGHRLEAVRTRGTKIQAVVMTGSEADARLWELSENLHRSDLTVLERSKQVAEWAELSADKPGQVVQVSAKGGRGIEGGASKAARELPVSGATPEAKRKTVARAIKIAGISPEAEAAVVAAGLDDNQAALLTIAEVPVETQVEAVAEAVAARAAPKSSIKRLMDGAAASEADRAKSFLARAEAARRGAEADDLAGLVITEDMEAARGAVVEAWQDGIGHEQREQQAKAERARWAAEARAEKSAIASIIAETRAPAGIAETEREIARARVEDHVVAYLRDELGQERFAKFVGLFRKIHYRHGISRALWRIGELVASGVECGTPINPETGEVARVGNDGSLWIEKGELSDAPSETPDADAPAVSEPAKAIKDTGGTCPFGFQRVDGELVPHEAQQQAIREIILPMSADKKASRVISAALLAKGFELSHDGVLRTIKRERTQPAAE